MSTENDPNGPKSEEVKTEDGVFSLTDLDQMIADQDPEFSDSMEKLGKDPEIKDAKVQDFEETPPEPEIVEKLSIKEKAVKKIKGGFETSIDFVYFGAIKTYKYAKKSGKWTADKSTKTLVFFKTEFPERINYYSKNYKEIKKLKKAEFKALSLYKKILVIFLPILVVSIAVLIYLSLMGIWIPPFFRPLVTHWQPDSGTFQKYNPESESMAFHRMFPEREHTILLPKVVANLKRGPKSGPNPMGYLEVFVAGNSQETAIEIKDRERELLDIVRLSFEKYSYEELNSQRGKENLKVAIAQAINRKINVGMVRRVYIKEIIIKP